MSAHTDLLDAWIGVLSRVGLHARQLTFEGRLAVWSRREVRGLTLMMRHGNLVIGDVVLLWSDRRPDQVVTDIGIGFERLRWALARQPWPLLVFGDLLAWSDPTVCDALRTATLLAANGVRPASRGPGGILRRLLRQVPPRTAALGLSRAVRQYWTYWSLVSRLPVPWHEACRQLEDEVLRWR